MAFCLDRTTPLAKKTHHCDVCFGVIGAGDTYVRERNIGDDGPYTFKSHGLCDAAYWKAHSDLNLYSDEPVDEEEARPLLEAFFRNMAVAS